MKKLSHLLLLFFVIAGCSNKTKAPTDPRENWESGYMTANNILMHYTRTGGEKPPLILVHSIATYGLDWTRVALELQNDYDVIMYDIRGHGHTDAPREGYDPETITNDLYDFIKQLEIEKPIIIGHELGGGIVALFASQHPDIAQKIILETPGGLKERSRIPDDFARKKLQDSRQQIAAQNKMSIEELVTECKTKVHKDWTNEIDIQEWAKAKRLLNPRMALLYFTMTGLGKDLDKISCPTLILEHTGNEAFVAETTEMMSTIPNHQLIFVENTTKNVRRENFKAYINHIQNFLNN